MLAVLAGVTGFACYRVWKEVEHVYILQRIEEALRGKLGDVDVDDKSEGLVTSMRTSMRTSIRSIESKGKDALYRLLSRPGAKWLELLNSSGNKLRAEGNKLMVAANSGLEMVVPDALLNQLGFTHAPKVASSALLASLPAHKLIVFAKCADPAQVTDLLDLFNVMHDEVSASLLTRVLTVHSLWQRG